MAAKKKAKGVRSGAGTTSTQMRGVKGKDQGVQRGEYAERKSSLFEKKEKKRG